MSKLKIILTGSVIALAVMFTSVASAYTFTTTLKQGSKGVAVQELQKALNAYSAETVVATTGAGSVGHESTTFGPATKKAVVAFQKKNGLAQVGQVGPATRALLNGTTPVTPGTPTTPQTGPLTVALASDNPAAGTIIASQATADLAHVTFSGTGTLNAITLQRTGVSDQSTLSAVYLYDGMTRLTDGYSFNNSGLLTMSGLNLSVSGTKTLSVRADVSACGTGVSCYSLGVTLTSFTSLGSTANAVSIKGNEMYIATGASLAGATFSANTVTGTPAVNPGITAYPVWSAPVTVSTRSLLMKSANFRVIGSAPSDALANVNMYKDGVAVGNIGTMTTINGSSYVSFDFSSAPVELTTGGHTLDVRADVVKGSARTIQLSLQQASDMMLYDQQIGVNVAAAGTIPNTAVSISINQGSVSTTVDPTFQSLTKITGGASNAVIAKFKIHGYGEDVKVNTLNILPVLASTHTATPDLGVDGLQNVTVYFNGSQVGSQVANTAATPAAIALTPGSQMIIPAGVDSYLEVRADLRTITSVNYISGSVHATLQASTGEGMNSHNTVTVAAVTGNTLTIQTGLLAVGSNTGYSSQVMNSNTQNVKLGSYTLQNQSTSESIRVTSMRITTTFGLPTYTSGVVTGTGSSVVLAVSSTVGFAVGDTITVAGATQATGTVVSVDTGTQLHVNYSVAGATPAGAVTDTSKTSSALTYVSNLRTTETSGNGATPVVPTGTDTYSVDFTLAPGAMKTIDVMGDLGAANFGTILTKLAIQGIGASSNIQIFSNSATSLTDVTGQTITLATGSMAAPALVTSSSTTAQFVAAAGTGAANATKATFKFTASNGVATISEIKFRAQGPVTGVTIGGQNGSVVGSYATGTGVSNVDVTGLNLSVPNGGNGVNFDALISYGPIGTGATASATTSAVELVDVIFTIGGQPSEGCTADYGTCSTVITSGATNTSPTMKLVGSKPTLTITSTSNAGLLVGENHLMDLVVAADSHGDVSLNTLVFNIASTQVTGPAVNASSTRLAIGSTTISNATCTITGTTAAGVDTCVFSGGYVIPAGTPVTFSLFGTTTGTLSTAGSSSVVTSLGASSTLSWNDDAGAASSTAITGATNTTYLYNYPTGTWSLHN